MKSKLEKLLTDYRNKLARKERLIDPYIKRKNESLGADWCTECEYAQYKCLEAEINLLKRIISDLEYISE